MVGVVHRRCGQRGKEITAGILFQFKGLHLGEQRGRRKPVGIYLEIFCLEGSGYGVCRWLWRQHRGVG